MTHRKLRNDTGRRRPWKERADTTQCGSMLGQKTADFVWSYHVVELWAQSKQCIECGLHDCYLENSET